MTKEQAMILATHVLYQDCAIAELFRALDDVTEIRHMAGTIKDLKWSRDKVVEAFAIELEENDNEH